VPPDLTLKYYTLPKECSKLFCTIFKINSSYFPVEQLLIYICNEDKVVSLEEGSGFLNII
jgi:hypothetical protein